MIKLFIILLSFTSAFAQDLSCPLEYHPIETDILKMQLISATEIAETSCTAKDEKEGSPILDVAVGCFSGGKSAVSGAINGFIELLKLVLIELPQSLMKEESNLIHRVLTGGLSPAAIAASVASISFSSQESIWEKAKSYWKEFKHFVTDLKNTLVKEIKGFPCLPLEKQSELICKGVSEVFLTIFGPKKFVQGIKWGINTGKAMADFIKASKMANGAQDLTLANRLAQAAEKLGKEQILREVLRVGDSTVLEVKLPNGQKILQLHKKEIGEDGKPVTIIREVTLDANTKAIDANSEIGQELLQKMAQSQRGEGSLIFIDVNHLGKANYFKDGTKGGDLYLSQVGEGIHSGLRPGDMLFKNGGDELVILINSKNPQVIQNISQRIVNTIDKDPKIRQIFRKEVTALTNKYKEINKAQRFDDLPEATKKSLTQSEVKLAQENFKIFQEIKKKELQDAFTDQARYRGSISVGSTTMRSSDEFSDALQRAEGQSAQVKASYKKAHGHDISKYNLDETHLPVTPPRKAPLVLAPVE